MAEHVFTMVIHGDAERDMVYALSQNLKHSDLSWWTEGDVVVRPDLCEREGHDWKDYGDEFLCDYCGEVKGDE